jgi:hypothetical protein
MYSPVFEARGTAAAEEELPEIEMLREILPSAQIITTIMQSSGDAENLPCVPHLGVCTPVHKCCKHLTCKPGPVGICV